MKIIINSDTELVKEIREKLKQTNGQCPCVLPNAWNENTKCMCKNFKDMVKNNISGECHCGLYVAIHEKENGNEN